MTTYVPALHDSGEIRRIAAALVKRPNWLTIIVAALWVLSILGFIICITLAAVHGASTPDIPYSADATAMHLRSGYSVAAFGIFTFGPALVVLRRVEAATKERRRMEADAEATRRQDTEALTRMHGMVRKNAELLEHLLQTQADALATHRQWATQLVAQVDAAAERRLADAGAQILGEVEKNHAEVARYRVELVEQLGTIPQLVRGAAEAAYARGYVDAVAKRHDVEETRVVGIDPSVMDAARRLNRRISGDGSASEDD